MRTAEIIRKTAETDIELKLSLDGKGESVINTGCGFLDHMLTLFAKHGRFDLTVTCKGDTQVDYHHSAEDIGIALGSAFSDALSDMKGSCANDAFGIDNGKVITETNNNGGINGGITNGMPIIFRTAIKPTPTIFKMQNTIDFKNMTETVLEPKGRHDPAIVHRARVVQDAAAAIVLCDALSMRFGTDYLK